MKNKFESMETFIATATIDAGYYQLSELVKEINKPTNIVKKLVDVATGYNKIEN